MDGIVDFAISAIRALSKVARTLGQSQEAPALTEFATLLFNISKALEAPQSSWRTQNDLRLLRVLNDLERACTVCFGTDTNTIQAQTDQHQWPAGKTPSGQSGKSGANKAFDAKLFPRLLKLSQEQLRPYTIHPSLLRLFASAEACKALVSKLKTFLPKTKHKDGRVPESTQQPDELSAKVYSQFLGALNRHIVCCCPVARGPATDNTHHCHLKLVRENTAVVGQDGQDGQDSVFDTAFRTSSNHHDAPNYRWKLVRFRIGSRRNNGKAARFDTSAQYSAQVETSVAPEHTLIQAGHICELILQDNGPVNVQVRAVEDVLYDMHELLTAYGDLAEQPSVSLGHLLKEYRLADDGKLILAYTLARSVWEFYKTEIMSSRWTAESVHLMMQNDSRHNNDPQPDGPKDPFVVMSFNETHKIPPTDLEFAVGKNLTHWAPRIMALGSILTLIFSEEGLIEIPAMDLTNIAKAYNHEVYMCKQVIGDPEWPALETKGIVATTLREAVAACLDEGLFNNRNMDINDRRNTLYKKVVWPLEYAVQISAICLDSDRVRWQTKPVAEHQPTHRGNQPASVRYGPMQIFNTTESAREKKTAGSCPEIVTTTRFQKMAEDWFHRLELAADKVLPQCYSSCPVKVAILDTGINFDRKFMKLICRNQIKEYRSWYEVDAPEQGFNMLSSEGNILEQGEDTDGHGSHIVSLLLKTAPYCEVYVARVFKDHDDIKNGDSIATVGERVAKALQHAADIWKVDVISMSFGFLSEVPAIAAAINKATDGTEPRIVFAAASNFAGNEDIAWPAKHERVICVHATDGNGNKYGSNPTPGDTPNEFAVLGTYVESWVRPNLKASRSGTSVATPIAAGVATLVLHLMRSRRQQYLDFIKQEHQSDTAKLKAEAAVCDQNLRKLCTARGMSAVFALMVGGKSRDGYRYMRPWKLLGQERASIIFLVEEILRAVREA